MFDGLGLRGVVGGMQRLLGRRNDTWVLVRQWQGMANVGEGIGILQRV
jgi:hypothetical protein